LGEGDGLIIYTPLAPGLQSRDGEF